MAICERCRNESPGGFRFCGTCGAPLPAGVLRHETRKVVTVIFCDATGWTALAEALDPEALRGVVNRYFKEIRSTIERHGGTVEKFIGDAVMAVFGIPQVHEDDALRAVRAAAEIRERLPAVAEEVGLVVRFRTGVNTGTVFIGQGESLAVGDAVNVAARLEQAAGPEEILLGSETLRHVRDAVEVEPLEPLALKGKSELVSAFRLLGVRTGPALDRGGWRPLGLPANAPAVAPRPGSPMVGRDEELALARGAFARAAASGQTQLLTVVGEAGIGKSRLAQELADQLAGEASVLMGRCLSYGEGIAFWPLREAVTQAAGGESRDAIRGLLDDADDADVVADIVAATLGLVAAEGVSEQVPWAFRRLFEVLGTRGPLLVVIEDVHWAEGPLLDLVDYLVDWLTAPVLLLCLARPDFLDVRPGWGGGRVRVSSLLLAPLRDQDAGRLLAEQLGERHLSAPERAQILEAAEGNPFFVEQLLAMSAEDSLAGREREIPATIQSLLAARLDRLERGERAVIERAALIGREFWPRAVVGLLPAEARSSAGQHLRALVHRGLIQPDRSTLAGEEQLRFHHILIRDIAYHSTPKTLRSELHERFADWIAQRGERYDEFVGYHLERAFRYRTEVERSDAHARALAARAGESLAVAGRRALSRGDGNGGVKLLRRAADLFEASGRKRPEPLLDLGAALSDNGDFGDAERVLQVALAEAQALHDEAIGARALIELSYRRALVNPSVPVAEMLSVADQAVEVFNRIGDEGGIARAWHHVAMVHWIRSRIAAMEEVLERALTHAERAGERREQSRILGYLARATVTGPRPVDDGIRRCRAILERAGDDVVLTAVTETMLAVLEAMQGRFDEARDRWRASKRRLEDVGLSVTVSVLQMYSAFIELMAKTPGNAEAGVAEAYSLLERIGEGHRRASTAAVLSRLLLEQDRHDESERFSRISAETASKDDIATQVVWRGTRARLLARTGESRGAEQLANSAVELAGEIDNLMLGGDALSDRAEVLATLSRHAAAARDLEQAIALYERKGMSVCAEAARRSLASLAPGASVGGSSRPA